MNPVVPKTFVKICGLKNAQTVRAMAGLPVDLIGLVFAPSKRQVSPAEAAEIAAEARAVAMGGGRPPRVVGVFVNPTMELLARTLAEAPLDVVQLHGAETPAFCRQVGDTFGVEVWRVLSIEENDLANLQENGRENRLVTGGDDTGVDSGTAGARLNAGLEDALARLSAYQGAVSTILLDTAGGGTGRTFRWERIPPYLEAAHRLGMKLFVAGGLTPDNVSALITSYHPDGVDISSGVETDGVKDIDKIASFAERVYRS
jgi:phosphoribosylanthranilate isomerase